MKRLAHTTLFVLALILIHAAMPPLASAQIQIFSSGQYSTPESISLVPNGFGTFGGSYFITDVGVANFWVLPNAGGPPVPFAAAPARGGVFLPPGWGVHSGKFLITSTPLGVYDSSGNMTVFDPLQKTFVTALIAPVGFGSYGGNLFLSSDPQDNLHAIWRVAPGGGLTVFKDLSADPFILCPFGLVFTPPGFGSFGNRLLVTNGCGGGEIAAIAPDGTASMFTIFPMAPQQGGGRQMLMAPNDYFLDSLGIPGQLLLLSVNGEKNGGGTLGSLLALDSSGAVAAHLQVGNALAKFDPRGMIFTADGHLLISDTSDPILIASARDFVPGRDDPDPLAVKQDVLNQLNALRATITDKHDRHKLDEVIDDLKRATDSNLWVNPAHLQPKGGGKVFDEEKDAVNKLGDLVEDKHSTIPRTVLQRFIDRLVQVDRVLAFVAIRDAAAAHDDPKKIAEAKKDLAKGDSEAARGRPDNAIEHYRNAWDKALKA